MDFYLNNLKVRFKEFVKQSDFFKQLNNSELDIDDDDDRLLIKNSFRQFVKKSLNDIIPKAIKTGTSVDDSDPIF